MPISTVSLLTAVIVLAIAVPLVITIVNQANTDHCVDLLGDRGYVVLAAGEYNTIGTKLDNIKTSADAAVVNAQEAVVAAQIAAAKVDLFNSAEVFLFPASTNMTITLVAGNTNLFGAWTEIADANAVTLSSRFASAAGYISDMHIYDHSAVDKLYLVEIAYGASKSTLGRIMYHTSFIEMAPIKSRRIPAGETIYYRMMCSGANNANAKVGFRYFYE